MRRSLRRQTRTQTQTQKPSSVELATVAQKPAAQSAAQPAAQSAAQPAAQSAPQPAAQAAPQPAAQQAPKEEEKEKEKSAPAEAEPAPQDSSGPLYSAYILIFFALFYIGTVSAFINRFGEDDCKIYTDSKKKYIRGAAWIMIGISIIFIIFGVCEAKRFIIIEWFPPKWIHMLSFIYYFSMFLASIFLYSFFNFNDAGNNDKFLLCDDHPDSDNNIIEGSIHSTIDILINILIISSIVMTLISLAFHMMKDTKGNT